MEIGYTSKKIFRRQIFEIFDQFFDPHFYENFFPIEKNTISDKEYHLSKTVSIDFK
jgi:hypothetical protein